MTGKEPLTPAEMASFLRTLISVHAQGSAMPAPPEPGTTWQLQTPGTGQVWELTLREVVRERPPYCCPVCGQPVEAPPGQYACPCGTRFLVAA